MNIILLSGGSGKRLWPLSNSARSKQFLRLLAAPDGTLESMLQRMVRQIRQARLADSITIATNASQVDSIQSQIGSDVNVVIEPERRDTFPAIALSAMNLVYERRCALDEVTVVMPCDPYTDAGYFEVVSKMAAAAETGAARLLLMGIKPDRPSSKYGYILPACGKSSLAVQPVRRFVEKPSEKDAAQLMAEGALWNGGVFAFRLGYIKNIVEKYVKADSFKSLVEQYAKLPAKSFDYVVAENEPSVACVPFSGKWKDLGTWDVLSDELSAPSIGSVKLAGKNDGTHVINELGQPVVCIGTSNLIVAATPDGILVADKNGTANLKDIVRDLPSQPMFEEHRWGSCQVLNSESMKDGGVALTKQLNIAAAQNTGYRLRQRSCVVLTIIEGNGVVVVDGHERSVKSCDVVCVPQGSKHGIYAKSDLTVLELQRCSDKDTDDAAECGHWEWGIKA